jgi:AraC family transcriptional regulator of adaptative response / DNA-3-methyladenine glycosylase II
MWQYQSKQPISQWQHSGIVYKAFHPYAALQPWVSKVWQMKVGSINPSVMFPILPDGKSRLVFSWDKSELNLWFGSPIATHYMERLRPNVAYFGLEFYCGAAGSLSPAPMSELSRTMEDLFELILPNEQREHWLALLNDNQAHYFIQQKIHQRLTEAPTFDSNNLLIKSALLPLINADDSVDIIAQQHNINRRQLHRLFNKHVGLSPVQLRRIGRAQLVLARLNRSSDSLTQLAHWANYHDQAHMNHDFLSLFGSPPGEFKKSA